MRVFCSVFVVVCTLGSAGRAAAQPVDPRAAAKEHFQKGTKYFDLGRFDEAIKEYEAAYEFKDEPVLLYNIAQAHRLAGHSKEAVHFYKSFLRRVPKALNRDEVQVKIDELEKLIAQQQKTQTLPPDSTLAPGEKLATSKPNATEQPPATEAPSTGTGTPPPAQPPANPPQATTQTPPASQTPPPAQVAKPIDPNAGKVKKIAGLALIGVGVVGIVVGGAMSALAVGAGNDVTKEAKNGQAFDPAKESAGHTDQAVAGAMYGIGGAALVAGAVLTYLGFRDAKLASHAMVTPVLGPSRAGVFVQLTF